MVGFCDKLKPVVVSRATTQTTKKVLSAIDEHITLGLCVSAAGDHLTPLIVLEKKNLPRNLPEKLISTFAWSGQSSGWMPKQIFSHWAEQVFLPELEVLRAKNNKPKAPVLLWLDGHSSRDNPDTMELFRKHNITVAIIPAHTSHIAAA